MPVSDSAVAKVLLYKYSRCSTAFRRPGKRDADTTRISASSLKEKLNWISFLFTRFPPVLTVGLQLICALGALSYVCSPLVWGYPCAFDNVQHAPTPAPTLPHNEKFASARCFRDNCFFSTALHSFLGLQTSVIPLASSQIGPPRRGVEVATRRFPPQAICLPFAIRTLP